MLVQCIAIESASSDQITQMVTSQLVSLLLAASSKDYRYCTRA